MRDEFSRLREGMIPMLFGPAFADASNEDRERVLQAEVFHTNLLYWLLFETFIEGPNHTIARTFLARKGASMPLVDRRYLEVMSATHLRLYKILDIRIDEGMRLRDCWDDSEYDVVERAMTHDAHVGMFVALRLRLDPSGATVIDGAHAAALTATDRDAIVAQLRDEWAAVMRNDGNADERFAFYHGPAIMGHLVARMLNPVIPRMVTTTGDPMALCTVEFAALDRVAAKAALDAMKQLDRNDGGNEYIWARGADRIVHATVELKGGRLLANTHSEKRAVAVRKLLEKNLGGAIRYRGTKVQDLMEAFEEHKHKASMPKSLKPKAAKRSSSTLTGVVYRLKVTLQDTKPPIWRRVLVRGSEPLDRVHMILNMAMGWTDTHLHLFEVGGKSYGVPDPDGEFDFDDIDERTARLHDLGLHEGAWFTYLYDFGDGWRHRVDVERIGPAKSGETYPICLTGRRACPPEDIGGSYGYRDVLAEPDRWGDYGPNGLDPLAFDLDDTNAALQKLPKRWEPF